MKAQKYIKYINTDSEIGKNFAKIVAQLPEAEILIEQYGCGGYFMPDPEKGLVMLGHDLRIDDFDEFIRTKRGFTYTEIVPTGYIGDEQPIRQFKAIIVGSVY